MKDLIYPFEEEYLEICDQEIYFDKFVDGKFGFSNSDYYINVTPAFGCDHKSGVVDNKTNIRTLVYGGWKVYVSRPRDEMYLFNAVLTD